MASMFRVGAGAQVERFQPDVLEEIRIMAEAAHTPYGRDVAPSAVMRSPFARLLGAMLAPAAHAA